MYIKTVFKSHFKVKKNFKKNTKKNTKKKIFIKNTIIFFIFVKVFFKNCYISFFFTKSKNTFTNILKAPSRHKKFFHQVVYEFFTTNVNFKFNNIQVVNLSTILPNFNKLNIIFKKLGSNTLTRTRCTIVFYTKISLNTGVLPSVHTS